MLTKLEDGLVYLSGLGMIHELYTLFAAVNRKFWAKGGAG